MDAWIEAFGYVGVLLGVAVEGEVVVLAAAYLAREGLLAPAGVAVSAFAGSIAVYQGCFWVGRRHGRAILDRHPALRARVEYVQQRVARHDVPLILGYRLLFGLRAVTPFALGLSGVPPRRFACLDTPVAAVWAFGLVAAGYGLGEGVAVLPGHVADAAGWTLLALLAALTVGVTWRGWRAYRRRPARGAADRPTAEERVSLR